MTEPIDEEKNTACGDKKTQTVSNASPENSEFTIGLGPLFKHATRSLKSSDRWPPSSSTSQRNNYNARRQSLKTSGEADSSSKKVDLDISGMNRIKVEVGRNNKPQQDDNLDLIDNLPYLIVDNDEMEGDIIDGENNFLILASSHKREAVGGGHRAGSNIRRREEGLEKLRKTFTEQKHVISEEMNKDGFHGDSLRKNFFRQPSKDSFNGDSLKQNHIRQSGSGNLISHDFSQALHSAGGQRQNETQQQRDTTHYRATRLNASSPDTKEKNTGACPREAWLRKSGRQHGEAIRPTELRISHSRRASSAVTANPVRSPGFTRAARRARSCGNQDDQSVSPPPNQARYEPMASRSRTHMPQRVRFVHKWAKECQKPSQQETSKRDGEQSIKYRYRGGSSVNPITACEDDANGHRDLLKQKKDSLHRSISNVGEQRASPISIKDIPKSRRRFHNPAYSNKQPRRISLSLPPMAVTQPGTAAAPKPQVSTQKSLPEDKNNEDSSSPAKRIKKGKWFGAKPNDIAIQDASFGHGGKKCKKLKLLEKRPSKNFVSKTLTGTQSCDLSLPSKPGNPNERSFPLPPWLKNFNTEEEQRETTKNGDLRSDNPVKKRLSQSARRNTGKLRGNGDWKGRKLWINEGNKGRQPFKHSKTTRDATASLTTSPNRMTTGQIWKQSPIKLLTNPLKQKVKEISPYLIGHLPVRRKKGKRVGEQNLPERSVSGKGKSGRPTPQYRQGCLTLLGVNEDLCGWESDKPELLCFLQETLDQADFRVPRAAERCSFVQHNVGNEDSGKHQSQHQLLHEPQTSETSATRQQQQTVRESTKTAGGWVLSSPPSTTPEGHEKAHDVNLRSPRKNRRARTHGHDRNHRKRIKKENTDKIRTKHTDMAGSFFKEKDLKRIVCEVLASSNQMAARLVELRTTIDMLQTKVEKRSIAMAKTLPYVRNIQETDCQVWTPTFGDYLKLVAFMGLQLLAQYVFVMK